MNPGGSQPMVPSLTAARRLWLRWRGQVSVVVAAAPLAPLLATEGYKLVKGLPMMTADSVTSVLGYLFIGAVVAALLFSVRTLQVLRRYSWLDAGDPSFTFALWCSRVALAAALLWLLLGLLLVAFFFGGR